MIEQLNGFIVWKLNFWYALLYYSYLTLNEEFKWDLVYGFQNHLKDLLKSLPRFISNAIKELNDSYLYNRKIFIKFENSFSSFRNHWDTFSAIY